MAEIFDRVAIIGIGLIGSSIARALKESGVCKEIVVGDINEAHGKRAVELGLCVAAHRDAVKAVAGADIVVICTPISTYESIADAIGPALKQGAIVTDVGSVKQKAIEAVKPRLPKHARWVAGHPVAGTENSGPDAGFAELFQGRWCVLTPPEGTSARAVGRVAEFWRRAGMEIATMSPAHHDRVLAITSHVPHLIAYTIVSTVSDLEETMRAEVIKFAASGFRDFTRVAGSDPTMWRDIFLSNREAVLEMTGRLYEDIALLQKAIRHGDGDTLHRVFSRSRRVRRGIVQAKQA